MTLAPVSRMSLLLAVCIGLLNAATTAALDLNSFLDAMPPGDAATAEALFDEVMGGGDALIFSVCDRIAPADTQVDAAAQFALYGLAKHVVLPGREMQRVRLNRVYEMALNRSRQPEAQRFFMSLLRLCGDATTVKALEPYVCDPAVYDDAVQTIAAIGGFEAVMPLLMMMCPELPAKDASVQNALATFGTQAYYGPDETGLAGELLAAITAPDSVADKTRAAALCREALSQEGLKPQYTAMVLYTLARLEETGALPELLRAVESPHPLVWGMALALAGGMPGEDISAAWVSKLPGCSDTVRPQVIVMLGSRKDPTAQQAVRDALADPLLEMRLAACQSITEDSGPAFLGPLMDAMAQADSEKEIQSIKNALLRIPGLESAVQQELMNRPSYADNLQASQKSACLEIIAERQASSFLNICLEGILDADERVRRTACAALGVIGTPAQLLLLYDRLLSEERDAEADAARDAVVALAKRLSKEEETVAQAGALLAGAGAKERIRLVKTLGAIGNAAALEAVRATTEQTLFTAGADVPFATALLETLGVWKDPGAAEMLLGFWQRLDDEALRLLALKQYIISVQRNYEDSAKQGDLVDALQGQCRNETEKQAVSEAAAKILLEGLTQ